MSDDHLFKPGNPYAGRWTKGVSGNPSGKAKPGRPPKVANLAKQYNQEMIERLVRITRESEKGSEVVAAAKEVLFWANEFEEKHPTSRTPEEKEAPQDLSAVSNDDLMKLIETGSESKA